MVYSKRKLQEFSEKQHRGNKWSSKPISLHLPLVYGIINFISPKRKHVYELAKENSNSLVLDLGCGKGSYSQLFSKCSSNSKIVSTDWSFSAISQLPENNNILPVIADAQHLPFKSNSFDTAFSIDTLGHIEKPTFCMNEIYRTVKPGKKLFIHSECADYKEHWPDKILIKKLKRDKIAEKDGHFFIMKSNELYKIFKQIFKIEKFYSPAGYTVWLTGYPENYAPLFKEAKMIIFSIISGFFSFFKRVPILKQLLQLLNSFINKIELYFGLNGGGSVFAILRKEE